MIQSLLTKETPEIIRFFRNIDSLSEMLDKLAEYRINGKLPYYKIGGKLLYKEKDILALLEKNRMEAFDV